MLVYIVYNNIHKSVYNVYEDEDEAIYNLNNLNSFENNNIIIEASLCKHEDSKFHYSEEDNNIDEEDYDALKDENKNLKNKVEDYEKVIKVIKDEYNELSKKYINVSLYSYIFLIILLIVMCILFILE
jgi:hypothetical protein